MVNSRKPQCTPFQRVPFHGGPWQLECLVFIKLSEAGDKAEALEEMVGSAFMQDFGPKFAQYLDGPIKSEITKPTAAR